MGTDTRFIVNGLNKLLKKNYNLISFNAQSPEDTLQVLSDVLAEIQQDGTGKIDVRSENPEQSAIRLLTALRILKYQPDQDPATFRQGLVTGDKDIIHDILKWILTNEAVARQRAYLSRFLVKIQVPPDFLGDPDVNSFYEQYLSLIEDFKTVHKEMESGKRGGETAAELKTDVTAMEKEREIITARVEKMKARIEPGLHLLEAAQTLRQQRDKNRELAIQKSEQIDNYQHLQLSLQRAESELKMLKQAEAEMTPQSLLQSLAEQVTVQTAIVKESLPAEIATKTMHTKALSQVINSPYLGTSEISAMTSKLDEIARKVQSLVESKASEVGADKTAQFRQQAAAISSIKRNTLEKLEKTKVALEELEEKANEKKALAKRMAEEPVPKGEEFKRYVARLKTKNMIYKRNRTELMGYKAEYGMLNRTLAILENQLPQIQPSEIMQDVAPQSVPNDFTPANAAAMNFELAQNISTFQTQLAPLVNELRPLRKTYEELQERHDKATKSLTSIQANLKSSTNILSQEVANLKYLVENDEKEAKELSEKVTKFDLSEKRIQQEMKNYTNPSGGPTLREELNESIGMEEKKSKVLKNEEKLLKEKAMQYENQVQQWQNLMSLFKCKLQCAEENKQRDGIVVRREGAETLVLE